MKRLFLAILMLVVMVGVGEAATLSNSNFFQHYYFGGDSNYLYGISQTTDTLVIRRNSAGSVSNMKDVSAYSATYDQITHIITTSTDNLIFAVVKDDVSSLYYLIKSVDGGANFGNNNPGYDDGDYVMQFGLDGAAQTSNVRVLGSSNFCEATISGTSVFLLGEYNVNGSRTNGGENDRVRLMKSTDYGSTWSEVITWNNDGSNNNIRHIHSVQQDPVTLDVYIATGDSDVQTMILRWNGTSDISGHSNHSPSWYGTAGGNITYASNGLSAGVTFGAQRYRAGDILFSSSYIHWGVDTTVGVAEIGIWYAAKDLSSATRADSQVASYTGHAILGGVKTSGGYYVFMDYLETTSTDFRTYFRISVDGLSWSEAGMAGLKSGGGSTGLVTVFEWNSKLYISESDFAGGPLGDAGGTLELAVDTSYLETGTPRILHPVYYIATDGNDSNTGRAAGAGSAWLTVRKALTSDQICRGAIVKIGPGTFNEGITAITSDYDTLTATTGNTIIKGSGDTSTIITGGSASALFLLMAEETNTDIRDLTFAANTAAAYSINVQASATMNLYNSIIGEDVAGAHGIRNFGTINVSSGCKFLGKTSGVVYAIRTETAGVSNVYATIFVGGSTGLLSIGNAQLTALNCTFYNFGQNAWTNATTPTVVPILKNNIFYGDGSGTALSDTGGLTETDEKIDYNLFYNVTDTANVANDGGSHPTSNEVNPLFISASDFHLQPTSPAISAGVFVPGFHDQAGLKDFAGQDVYGMPGYDIGAYGTVKPTARMQGGTISGGSIR